MNFGKSYANAKAAFSRVKELEIVEEEKNGQLIPDKITKIQIKNLMFQYPNDTRELINRVSISFMSGKIYQIKGENGCGKSTFLNLLTGLYETNGEICFNGISINLLDMLSIRRKKLSIVEQEPPLIFGSVSENIVDKETDKDALYKIIHEMQLDSFIGNLNILSNRSLIDGSRSLSGGEKQKAAIVKALLRDSDILILDEPTSALDTQSCNQLKEILNRYKENRIIILVDHQPIFSDIVDESYIFCLGKILPELPL